MSFTPDAFDAITNELTRKPLCATTTTKGKSLTFGVVTKRSAQPDYSRQNWLRPLLYKALLDFASKHITIPYTTIALTLNKKPSIDGAFQVSFGDNYHLTYYQLADAPDDLPRPSVVQLGNKHYFKRGDTIIRDGQPLKAKSKGITKVYKPIVISFN